MAEVEEAEAEEAAAEAAAMGVAQGRRAPSLTPIPEFNIEELLDIFTQPIGDEKANGHVRQVELPATASEAVRTAYERTRVDNEATGERENKQTLMVREQYIDVDDKAAPGRQRYRHGSRMAIISEDEAERTGFWQGGVYQVHCAVDVVRKLPTKAGPLLLEGTLEVGYARIAELRKGVGQGSVSHPRLSVRRSDVTRGDAVLIPLVADADGVLREDRSEAPSLVPLVRLGCKLELEELTAGDAYQSGSWRLVGTAPACGGAPLQALVLDDAAFASSVMMGEGELPFEEMKLKQLKHELAARGVRRSGLKAMLQHRLHGLLVQAAITACAQDEAEASVPKEKRPADPQSEAGKKRSKS